MLIHHARHVPEIYTLLSYLVAFVTVTMAGMAVMRLRPPASLRRRANLVVRNTHVIRPDPDGFEYDRR
jgi:hypothetical protein